jgi:hypothetical protein
METPFTVNLSCFVQWLSVRPHPASTVRASESKLLTDRETLSLFYILDLKDIYKTNIKCMYRRMGIQIHSEWPSLF